MTNEIILATATGTAYAIVGWVKDIQKRTWNDAGSDKYRALGASAGFEIAAPHQPVTRYYLRPKSKFVIIPGRTVYAVFRPTDVVLTSHPSDEPRTALPPDADGPLLDVMQSPSYRYRIREGRRTGRWM